MDRPKHRRLILAGLVLLAGAVLLLLGRQWISAPAPVPARASMPARQVVQQQAEKVEPATVAVIAPSAPPPPSAASSATATGFRGKIIDAVTRQPVKEFHVQLLHGQRNSFSQEGTATRHFKSATGRFRWTDVPEDTWRAAVTAPGYQQFNVDDVPISRDKAAPEIVMPMARGYAVHGRVFEISTGAGVVDAWISFRPVNGEEDHTMRRTRAMSKEDGSFTLDGIPGGDVILTVAARDHAPKVLLIAVDEKTPPQEIAISTGGLIAGMVTTAAGAPVKGAIHLLGPGMNMFMETNEAGQFRYPNMQSGRYRLSANTGAGGATQDFVLGQDEIKDGIVITLEAGRTVRGMVRGVRADQLDRVRVMLYPESKPNAVSSPVSQQGTYVLSGVPPGHAVITAFGGSVQFDKAVDVPADQDVTVNIDFPAGARLSGRVTQGGKPVLHKMVWMRPVENKSETLYQVMTSEDGLYEIEGLPTGDYFLRADQDISRRIAIAGDAVLNIDIPLVQLSARVVEDGGSVPIVGANVYVRGMATETSRVRGDKQTDDFGQFAFTGIEPGEIVLMVYKPGYEMHREKIAYSAPITNRTISLRKSAGVDVRVKPGSRRFPIGFTLTLSFPGNDYIADLWMPLDRESVCHVPSALAGMTLQIGRFSGEPIVIEEWDGQSFELP